jgi:peptidoglycan hydrolase-like protein with peptidoglycan-binding domain
VKALQHALNARPYLHLEEDGSFGPLTERAVREFQARVRLTPDGVVGPKTDALLWCRSLIANVRVQAPLRSLIPTPSPQPPPPLTPLPPAPALGSPNAPPDSGAGFVQQVSIGGQISLTPWLVLPSPTPGTPNNPIWSGVISYALVYRTKSEGPHFEFALSPQFAVNSRNQSADPRFGLQVNGQVTFADLVAPGRFHLISPFLQATAAAAISPGVGLGGGFAIGNQVSFDLISDRLQLTLQAGVGAQWSNLGRPDASFSVLGQGAIGTTIQF